MKIYSAQTLVTRLLVLLLCNTSLVQRAQCAGPYRVTHGMFLHSAMFKTSLCARQHLMIVHHRHLGQEPSKPLPTCKSNQLRHHLLSFTGQGAHGTREEARQREAGKGEEER